MRRRKFGWLRGVGIGANSLTADSGATAGASLALPASSSSRRAVWADAAPPVIKPIMSAPGEATPARLAARDRSSTLSSFKSRP